MAGRPYSSGMHTATPQSAEAFVTVDEAAGPLGVPASWLRSEVTAHRLPSIKAGVRRLVNVPQVRQALLERAIAEGGSR